MSARLGELLVKEKLITQDQLKKAIDYQREHGGRLPLEIRAIAEYLLDAGKQQSFDYIAPAKGVAAASAEQERLIKMVADQQVEPQSEHGEQKVSAALHQQVQPPVQG